MDLGNSILETEEVGKSSISKKKRHPMVSPSKVDILNAKVNPIVQDQEEVVIIAKKKVPGMIPRVQDRRAVRRL